MMRLQQPMSYPGLGIFYYLSVHIFHCSVKVTLLISKQRYHVQNSVVIFKIALS